MLKDSAGALVSAFVMIVKSKQSLIFHAIEVADETGSLTVLDDPSNRHRAGLLQPSY